MYHLVKKSRVYYGRAYCDETGELSFNTLAEALAAKEKYTKFNPVGWDIFDSETKELVG